MMLTGGGLRVALVTTHLPLKDISAAITKPLIESVVRILEHDLRHKFGIAKPVILVTGLNPHAGEGGHLGHEEIDTIIPALHALQAEGIDARGPLSGRYCVPTPSCSKMPMPSLLCITTKGCRCSNTPVSAKA